MKNIYEDANNRINQNVADSQNENSANTGNNAAQNNNFQNVPMMPALQLTPEQVSALISQLYTVQQAMQNGTYPSSQPQQQPQPQQNGANRNFQNNDEGKKAVNPGKRILYQSPDFDDVSDKNDDIEDLSLFVSKRKDTSSAPQIESKQRTVFDDDSLFETQAQLKQALKDASQKEQSFVKTTDFGSAFSVSEVEFSGDELPDVSAPKSEKKQPPEKPKSAVIMPDGDYFSAETIDLSEVINSKNKSQRLPAVSQTAQENSSASFFSSMQVEDVEEEKEEKKDEKKKLDTTEIIRRVVLAIALIAIVISGAVLIKEYKLHKDNQNLEENISDLIITEAQTEPTSKKNNKEESTKKNDKKEETTVLSEEQQWAEIKAQYPNVVFPQNLQLKYAKLYATNPEFVGYLSADGINLNLPVVQTDNDEDYLEKNFYGKKTKYGCPFVTHVNNITELDTNTIIFGHHMNDGTVFGALDQYKTIEGFKKAPVITFNTLYKDYQWKVIAAFITNADEEDDNGYVFKYYFASLSTEERYSAYFNELASRSLYDTGVDVLPTDKILTLSTCSHEFDNARFVVVARLVRPGESATVNTDNAVVNASPRYPQAYYDKKKQTNPYKNAVKWEVG